MVSENARGSRRVSRAAWVLGAAVVFIAAIIAALQPWRGSAEPFVNPALQGAQAAVTVSATIPVDGMICVICAASVRQTVRGVDGVTGVEVDLAAKRARVTYVEGQTSPEQIAAAIARRGYKTGVPTVEQRP